MRNLPLLLAVASAIAFSFWLLADAPEPPPLPATPDSSPTHLLDVPPSGTADASMMDPNRTGGSPGGTLVNLESGSVRTGAAPRRVGRFGPEVPEEGRTSVLLPELRSDGSRVPGEILFTAGPNQGERVVITADGDPKPVSVFPGFAIVEARTSGGALCRRELLLDHRRETSLELDFTERGWVAVEVTNEGGDAIEGAQVMLDGLPGTEASPGTYRCAWSVSGAPLLTILAPGHAPYRKILPDSVETSSRPQLAKLSRAHALTVHMPGIPGFGSAEPALLVLVPTGAPMSRTSPVQYLVQWQDLTTVPVQPGGSVRIDGLPNCRLEVFAYHPGGTIGPDVAYLDGKEDKDLALSLQSLQPAEVLSGRVLENGEPVPSARVTLRYANPIRATHRFLGKHAKFARRMPIGILPSVEQELKTDELGRFQLGLYPEVIRRSPYVTVTSPDGEVTITRLINDPSQELVFDLDSPKD